jgi:hypothetical protein
MASRRSRESAYADLVAGLLDVRADPATDRFDAELAAAEEDGRVDPQTAKVLRWWQRESLRALVDHARTVVPPTLLAIEQAAGGAGREAEEASQSWARAAGDDLGGRATTSTRGEPAGPVAGPSRPDPPVAQERPVPPPTDLAEHRRRLLVAGLTRVHPQT